MDVFPPFIYFFSDSSNISGCNSRSRAAQCAMVYPKIILLRKSSSCLLASKSPQEQKHLKKARHLALESCDLEHEKYFKMQKVMIFNHFFFLQYSFSLNWGLILNIFQIFFIQDLALHYTVHPSLLIDLKSKGHLHHYKLHQIFQFFMGFHMVPLLKRKVWRFFRAGPNGPSPPTHFWQQNSAIPPPSSLQHDLL